MFKIGEFSKMAQAPVPTLRYYDQIGLLKPISVDDFSGYRYYSASQVPRLHRIVALKGLGFSLEQIAAVLDEGLTPEQLRGMLRLRHAQISQQIDDMQGQLRDVEGRLEQIEREAQLSAYDVVLKPVEPVLVALVRAILPTHDSAGALFGEVYAAIGDRASDAISANPGVGGATMVLWYDTEFKDQNVDGAAAFVLRMPVPESGRMRVHELPACTMAAAVHHGTYDTIGDAHEAVLTWIEANGYIIAGPDREVYLYNAPPIRRDDPSYVTEIQYPVEKAPSPTGKPVHPANP
jgi:DNA-binding transcriptional MerR regulator/predicted transcriptional regulator YdeE